MFSSTARHNYNLPSVYLIMERRGIVNDWSKDEPPYWHTICKAAIVRKVKCIPKALMIPT